MAEYFSRNTTTITTLDFCLTDQFFWSYYMLAVRVGSPKSELLAVVAQDFAGLLPVLLPN